MPVLNVKTVSSKVGWTNPSNPDMVSYDLTVDVGGKKAEARTYSKQVAEVGFEGEVETYEKNDHTYLKQVKKDGYQAPARYQGNSKPAYKDNSDGMRQGMCFNNAANIVNAIAPKDVTPEAWASAVFSFASALYKLGDLNKPAKDEIIEMTEENIEGAIDLSLVDSIFGTK